jgi:hypothetical protein
VHARRSTPTLDRINAVPYSQIFPDEVAVALCVYGEDLEPSELTALLGASPTHAHRKGDQSERMKLPATRGAWIREVRKFEPIDPDAMFAELLAAVSADLEVWARLAARFEIRFDLAVHTDVGCTLTLAPQTMRMISERHGSFQVYIQAYGDNAV